MIAKFYLSKGEIEEMLTLETQIDNAEQLEYMIMQLPKEKIVDLVEIVYTGLLEERKSRDVGVLLIKRDGIEEKLYEELSDDIFKRLNIRVSGILN